MDTTLVGGPEKYVGSSGKFASIPQTETVTNAEVSSQPVKVSIQYKGEIYDVFQLPWKSELRMMSHSNCVCCSTTRKAI